MGNGKIAVKPGAAESIAVIAKYISNLMAAGQAKKAHH